MNIKRTFAARSVLSSFAVWVVYALLSAAGHEKAAYAGGLIVVLIQFIPEFRARRVKVLDAVTLLFFLAGIGWTVVLRSSAFLDNSSVLG